MYNLSRLVPNLELVHSNFQLAHERLYSIHEPNQHNSRNCCQPYVDQSNCRLRFTDCSVWAVCDR